MPPIILLIENDVSFIYLLRRYVEQSGNAFAHAPSIEAAHAIVGGLRPALVVLNRLVAQLAERSALAALQTELATHDTPVAAYSPAVVEAATAPLGVDYELALPLLYDDFCAALAALGIERPDAGTEHRKEVRPTQK